ncbi:MAG: hypothetical protein CMQ20_05045 [Gammaproteobacteria bacterium]|mgnify:FL=1|jgi:uncharacterized membrane protein YfcA|nr:hypothetical protein [Gammaproteobacteria bacterium]|tara:strand:+ start:1561 stop:2292 length:732 start_codon:yes stop_codon:yes gene_type:complete
MIYVILVATTLLTSLVSGVLSMAGGMILMGVFGFFLSVPVAMVLHGVAQAFSNGSRVWLYRRHIRWTVLVPYTLGALLVLAIFSVTAFVPDIGLVFILIGSFPLISLVLPTSINLDMQKGHVAFISGLLVTTAQMLAGASGPVLDIFYIKSSLTRHEILGTKAVTQTLGHIIKLVYYSFLMGIVSQELPVWVFPAVIIAALAGNWMGKQLVEKISDDQFKTIGRYIILIIGFIYLGKGVYELA